MINPIVTAEIEYAKRDTPQKPRLYYVPPPEGEPTSSVIPEKHRMVIEDRSISSSGLSLDAEGFILLPHASRIVGNYPLKQESTHNAIIAYRQELEAHLKWILNAPEVRAFNHVVRNLADKRSYGSITRAHVDYTEYSGPLTLKNHYPGDADTLLRTRVRILTVWRPLNGPTFDMPLAVCDARTVQFNDLIPTDQVFKHHIGENYSIGYNKYHRWNYFSAMKPNEILIFKNYDSREDVARFTPHAAFELPDEVKPERYERRESIETRFFVFGG